MSDFRTNLVAFMRSRGWQEPAVAGSAGALWSHPGTEWRVPVPHVVDSGAPDWPLLLERLAKLEQLSVAELAREIQLANVDVLKLRAVDFEDSTQSIPYKTGVALAQHGWAMLRACATTATGVKASIRGNYRKSGDEIIETARMAQTQVGSYIIPIYIPLSDPITLQNALPGTDTAVPDPPERRVSRTFTTALSAVADLVIRPASAPSHDTIHHLINTGVSKEFTASLGKILASDGLRTFSTKVEWAPTLRAQTSAARQIEIPAAASKLVNELTTRLGKVSETARREALTGTVVGVFRDQDDTGRVTVSTYRSGRPCHVHVDVSGAVLNQTLDWMKHKYLVVTEGTIRRVGDGLQSDGLDNIRLLHEPSEGR